MKVILEAIVGSHAYGLATENSDVDLKGIFVAPTIDLLKLNKPKETIDKKSPDITYHEVEKVMRLACKANPSILELFYMDEYTKLTDEGKMLIEIRDSFLSTAAVFNAYKGYVFSQVKKLNTHGHFLQVGRGEHRQSKHCRHIFRLLEQGRQLLTEGKMNVRVKDRDKIFEIGSLPVDKAVTLFEEELKKFEGIESILPDKPNYDIVNEVLLEIRRLNYVL